MKKIDLLDYIPERIVSGKNGKSYETMVEPDDDSYILSYQYLISNQFSRNAGTKRMSMRIPQYIDSSPHTFQVLGLLHAEGSKTARGTYTFCNNQPNIINLVLDWFEKQFNIPPNKWKWSIKLNIKEPKKNYKELVEKKVAGFWTKNTRIVPEKCFPKKVTYIKNVNHTVRKDTDFGSLVLEIRWNIFNEFVRNFVNKIFLNYSKFSISQLKEFMKGILAGESNVEIHLPSKCYRIFLSAIQDAERIAYKKMLSRVGIKSIDYPKIHAVVISKKENILKVHKLKLMEIHKEKYKKFLQLISLYNSKKSR